MTDLSKTPDEQLNVPTIKMGRYQHYKGDFYEVMGVSLDSETLQPFVIYKPLYNSTVSYWTRPYDMFIETVVVDGKAIPRFTYQESEK